MARTISARAFEDLKGCIPMIDLRFFEHRERDKNVCGESLSRAEQELQKAMQIIARIEQQQPDRRPPPK